MARIQNRMTLHGLSRFKAVSKIRDELLYSMEKILHKKGFIRIQTPYVVPAAMGKSSEAVRLEVHNQNLVLRRAPEFFRQVALMQGLSRTFELGPSWRLESERKSHLTEYTVVAPEFRVEHDEGEIMEVEEDLVTGVVASIVKNCVAELELLGSNIRVPHRPFRRMTYSDFHGLDMVQGPITSNQPIRPLASQTEGPSKRKSSYGFAFVTGFPFDKVAFYNMRCDSKPVLARYFDLVYNGQEFSSGGQREHRQDELRKQAEERGIEVSHLEWYFDSFRGRLIPHGGFTLGIERLLTAICNVGYIDQVVQFPIQSLDARIDKGGNT